MITNIVIPVHNRLEHTKQTIETLYNHTNPNKYFLAIIDDASDIDTSTWLDAFHHKHGNGNILLHRNSEPIGPGACKNLGYEFLRKEDVDFFYVSDNDVYFKIGWLEQLEWAYLANDKLGFGFKILGGARHSYHLPKIKPTLTVNDQKVIQVGFYVLDAQAGFSQFMTIDTFEKFGPYDENSDRRIMSSEDFAICQKVTEAGFKVGSIFPEVLVHTGKTNSFGDPATGHENMQNIPGVYIE